MAELTTFAQVATWNCRLAAAIILPQILAFKFTAAPESAYKRGLS